MSQVNLSETAALNFARFIVAHRDQDLIPQIVKDQAKKCLLDTLGCILAGSTTESGRSAARVAQQLGGKKESYIYGFSWAGANHAALANGTMAHSLEYDDSMYGHTGCVVIPAVLAVAEKCKSGGEEILTAITLGYEIFGRIGKVLNGLFAHERGFHPTALAAPFGAAAVAGFLLKLDASRIAWAFGIAGSQASGVMECLHDGSWTKRLHPGWGAHAGIIAALLGQAGFLGPHSVIEGEDGFFKAFMDKKVETKDFCEGLYERYLILNNHFKMFSCCRQIHSSLTAIKKIMEEHPLPATDIKEIRCTILQDGYHLVGRPSEHLYAPRNVVDAQFSLPFNVASAILYPERGLDAFDEENLVDPEIISLARRVQAIANPDYDSAKVDEEKYPATVQILFHDGSEIPMHVEACSGHPRNPATFQELKEKFLSLSGLIMSHRAAKELSDFIMSIENERDAAKKIANRVSEKLRKRPLRKY